MTITTPAVNGAPGMASVDLDVCHATERGETLDHALADLTAGLDLTTEVVNENGPGGGWPVVRFTGTPASIDELLLAYHDGDADAVAAFKSGGTPIAISLAPVSVDLDITATVPADLIALTAEQATQHNAVALAAGLDITAEIITMSGPGGGNPLVKFTAMHRGLIECLIWRYASTAFGDGQDVADEVAEFMKGVTA